MICECGCDIFITKRTVVETIEVDRDGNWLDTTDTDCDDELEGPYKCYSCGQEYQTLNEPLPPSPTEKSVNAGRY